MNEQQKREAVGQPDPSFGNDGRLTLPFCGVDGFMPDAMLEQPGNNLLVAITGASESSLIVVACFSEDGTLNKEFGDDKAGFVNVRLRDGIHVFVSALSALNGGGWLMAGAYSSGAESGLFMVKQHADGRLDQLFGEEGVRYVDVNKIGGFAGARITLQSIESAQDYGKSHAGSDSRTALAKHNDEKIILLTSVYVDEKTQRGLVLSFNPDGTDNLEFNGGSAIVELQGIVHDYSLSKAAAHQSDGKVVVCGRYHTADSQHFGAYVIRFEKNGQIDPTFNGGLPVNIPHTSVISLDDMIIRNSDDAIFAVGQMHLGNSQAGVVVVLNAEGSFNLVFNNGKPLFVERRRGINFSKCALLRSGNLVVGGYTGDGFVSSALTAINACFLLTGTLNENFGENGYIVLINENTVASLTDMQLMEDGRIVIAGILFDVRGSVPAFSGGWLARYR